MKMPSSSVKGMAKAMMAAYKWDTKFIQTCKMTREFAYPPRKQFMSFKKCMYFTAKAMAADRDFGLGYMTMGPSNYTRLGSDMYKVMMAKGGMEMSCAMRGSFVPRYNRSANAMVKKCAYDATMMFKWLKTSAMKCMAKNWLEVFYDVSKATSFAEKMDRSCDI